MLTNISKFLLKWRKFAKSGHIGRDSHSDGSNPGTVYWMDIFSHTFVVKIVMMFV